jgi:hypothetical protein
MKLKHSYPFVIAATILAFPSCTVVETTALDGTRTTTTTISGEGIAIGAAGAAMAVNSIQGDK